MVLMSNATARYDTPAAFKAWRLRLGLTQTGAGRELGRTKQQIIRYETEPEGAGDPAPYPVPRVVQLACAALEFGPLSIVRRKAHARPSA